ncbi:MAG: adenylate/guanylate cyclase domain-containing protein, partial [Chthoniobacterales bacterium]|nr:adenylate/guanylate cyclase domain-containing protein [Chthoniobacterales bacterium]
MFPEEQNLEPEIAHILSIDVVGYSKLLVNQQIELLNQLKRIVRETKCSCAAEASGRLIRLPTGDGMVLLFFRSPEEPLQCAVEISEALQPHPEIKVRMGAHSGPVNMIEDVNDRLNVAGAGVNVAQRVLDSGDAGHILLSKRLANDLAEYSHWRPHLYDLGECVVKHGFKLQLVNFHRDTIGNPARPQRLQQDEASAGREVKAASRHRYFWLGGVMLVLLAAAALTFFPRFVPKQGSAAADRGIAVLPFKNWNDDSEESYFADGVQGEILTLLSKVAALKVISRTSVMRYSNAADLDLAKVAEELQVRYFLEGSVQ